MSASTNADENLFVWVVSYDGAEGFAARDAEYYCSAARAALDADPARHIAASDTRMLSPLALGAEP